MVIHFEFLHVQVVNLELVEIDLRGVCYEAIFAADFDIVRSRNGFNYRRESVLILFQLQLQLRLIAHVLHIRHESLFALIRCRLLLLGQLVR